jgi:hypothetical protein
VIKANETMNLTVRCLNRYSQRAKFRVIFAGDWGNHNARNEFIKSLYA